MPLRLAAWNVRGFRAGARRLAGAIADEEPDVVLLQEVGKVGLRLHSFARILDMRLASGLRFWRRGVPNAVLLRPPWRIVADSIVRLAPHRGLPLRGVTMAIAGHAGARLTAASVHLGLSDPERLVHAREIADRLPALRQPVVLGGDLNERPHQPAAAWLRERLWDAFEAAPDGPGETYPASNPSARIDYLLCSEGLRVQRAWVRPDLAELSDHLPVFADVELEG